MRSYVALLAIIGAYYLTIEHVLSMPDTSYDILAAVGLYTLAFAAYHYRERK